MLKDRVWKANIVLYTCKKAIGLKWGMSPQMMPWLYIGIIRHILTYGIVTWWPILENKSSLKKCYYSKLNCRAVHIRRSAHHSNGCLHFILHILSIDLYVKQISVNSALRMRESRNWKTSSGWHRNLLNNYAKIPKHTDYCISSAHIFPT